MLILRYLLNGNFSRHNSFIPKHHLASEEDINRIKYFLFNHNKLLILTGAGISTESGIPDYRSEGVGLYARSSRRPITIQEFLKSEKSRKRYWARNFIGWPKFSSVDPNSAHVAVKDLEINFDKLQCLVTQNVDSLHTKAGSKNIIELHGTAFNVKCLDCTHVLSRHTFQKTLTDHNPYLRDGSTLTSALRPDGDVDLLQSAVDQFQVPSCEVCGGLLIPDIVFFGDNVPLNRVEEVRQNVEASDAVLVIGSSLAVFSSYRIILQAVECRKPIAIINIGKTRADKYANLKIEAKCSEVLRSFVCS